MTHKSTSDVLEDILQYLQAESVCARIHRDSQEREWLRSHNGGWQQVKLLSNEPTTSEVSQSVVKATLNVQPYQIIPLSEATTESGEVVWWIVGE
jgi:hypothetical protein